ncbi:DUF3291 domain-containing protein [Neobacillus sp. PS2-9]|uniref:DUF3291 domain-containing protein n=1 Tax=Neobacillus sp. PS2-9 TaxID=3070676 RepID=UPI0027DF906C|nr:DUF3291 domain-containing protein [Neobacillus sp. PS2-9]WML58536.1 DUF3291 domain-containing protein [Neobacillus sp. PS2-9]
MAFVAIYTVGRLKHPNEHPASREFFEVGHKVIRQASSSGQLIKEFSPDGVPFPEEVIKGEGSPILTLTVWRSLQSLYRFTYSGKHKQALRDRSKWIEPHQEKQPTYVVWWTEMVKDVSWEEAFKRYNHYIQHGPTPFAFDYKHAFDECGKTLLVN